VSITSVLFPTGEYTVTRTATGAYVSGRYQSGEPESFTIIADVQPVTGELLRDLPEGMRADETRVVFTTAELRALDDASEPDVIDIDGYHWRVVRVQRFRALADRTRAWCERLGPAI
jgi:hypothetical protein